MDLNDVFGEFPGRPDHPDFWRMSEVVLRLDGLMEHATKEEHEAIWRKEVQKHANLESLGYLALQRTFRVLGVQDPREILARMDEITPMMQTYMDAFIVGCNYKEAQRDG